MMLHLRHLWKSARVLQRLKKSCARQPRNFFAMTSTMQQASQILENEQWANHVKGHLDVEVSEDLTESSVTLPGFTYGDLDRTGDVEAWRMLMMIQAAEDNILFRSKKLGRDMVLLNELLKGKLVFAMVCKLDVMPDLYTKKDDFMYDKIHFRQYLNKVGNTSLEMVKELHCLKGFPLVRATQNLVVVDRETHVPARHPPTYLQRFGKIRPKIILERFIKPEKPSNAFRTTYRVVWTDTDYYYHSNQTAYLRFAVNAATEAAFAGKFQHLPKGDLAHHKINCMTMMFAAETNPGDNLDLYVWEDPMIQRRVFCQIEKADKLVYVTSIDFFGKQVVEPVVAAQDSKI